MRYKNRSNTDVLGSFPLQVVGELPSLCFCSGAVFNHHMLWLIKHVHKCWGHSSRMSENPTSGSKQESQNFGLAKDHAVQEIIWVCDRYKGRVRSLKERAWAGRAELSVTPGGVKSALMAAMVVAVHDFV